MDEYDDSLSTSDRLSYRTREFQHVEGKWGTSDVQCNWQKRIYGSFSLHALFLSSERQFRVSKVSMPTRRLSLNFHCRRVRVFRVSWFPFTFANDQIRRRVQVAAALIPLAQALFANGDIGPARETCTRALKILQVAYGSTPSVEVPK